MRRSGFRELQIWQKSKALCPAIYQLTATFPEHEKFGIVSQIRRSSVSVPSNIAEGHGRSSDADFIRFLHISLGSIRELETLLEISVDLGYIESVEETLLQLEEISKMVSSLITKLKANV